MKDQITKDHNRTDRINPLGVIRNPLGENKMILTDQDTDYFSEESILKRRQAMELDLLTSPMTQAQEIMAQFSQDLSCLDSSALKSILSIKAETLIGKKDSSDLQELLLAQTLSLNAVYQYLIQRIGVSKSNKPEHEKLYLDLALRFQKQSLKTIEVISNLQNPRTPTFIQQNMNADNIQVNNSSNELSDR